MRNPNSGGFTLIELMVTVAIATILISIAIPAYNTQIRKSRRTEAKTALLDLAGREERFYNTSSPPNYSSTPSDLGYGAEGAGADIPPNQTLVFDMTLLTVTSAR